MGAAFDTSFVIDRVETFHLALTGRSYWEGYLGDAAREVERFVFSPGWRTVYPRHVEAALVRVRLADGTVGWGEPNAPVGPEVTCLIARNLLRPIVRGREFGHPEAMWDFLYDTQRGRGHTGGFYLDAIAGLDLAVWDALARRAGVPLAALLADRPRAEIPVYLSGLRQTTLEERVAHAREWAGRGLSGVKIFLKGDTDAGARELDALQAGVPEIRRWMVDVLWSCPDLEAAAEAKAAYGDRGAEWLECPLVPEDLDGHRRLAGLPGAPVALGESLHTHHEAAPWFAEPRAVDVFQPDVGRCGISDGLRQKRMAEAAGIRVTPHMGSGLHMFQAATLHFAAACGPELLCEFQGGLAGRLGDAVDGAWAFADGAFRLPDRPGIGVEVDEERLARFVVPA